MKLRFVGNRWGKKAPSVFEDKSHLFAPLKVSSGFTMFLSYLDLNVLPAKERAARHLLQVRFLSWISCAIFWLDLLSTESQGTWPCKKKWKIKIDSDEIKKFGDY